MANNYYRDKSIINMLRQYLINGGCPLPAECFRRVPFSVRAELQAVDHRVAVSPVYAAPEGAFMLARLSNAEMFAGIKHLDVTPSVRDLLSSRVENRQHSSTAKKLKFSNPASGIDGKPVIPKELELAVWDACRDAIWLGVALGVIVDVMRCLHNSNQEQALYNMARLTPDDLPWYWQPRYATALPSRFNYCMTTSGSYIAGSYWWSDPSDSELYVVPTHHILALFKWAVRLCKRVNGRYDSVRQWEKRGGEQSEAGVPIADDRTILVPYVGINGLAGNKHPGAATIRDGLRLREPVKNADEQRAIINNLLAATAER